MSAENFPLIEMSREALSENVLSLLGKEFSLEKEKALLQLFDEHERVLTHWKVSEKTATEVLQEFDRLLNTCGIEYLFDQSNPVFEETCIIFCNTGDSYAQTIIYYNGGFYIGDCAALQEFLEENNE